MFKDIIAAPADPILGISDIFNADQRFNKINLSIGVYQNEDGITPVLNSVKKAEQLLMDNEVSKNYLGIEGLSTFIEQTQKILLGENHPAILDRRVRTAQTPGGTGALRIAADFLAKNTNAKRIWIAQPSWPNHNNIFTSAGLQVCEYNYYDSIHNIVDFNNILRCLQQARPNDIFLLQGCCYNPVGADLTMEQWEKLADLSIQNKCLPLFDLAYQGFSQGLQEDVQAIRMFANKHEELIIANSYSKNFGLYNERVGACTLIASDKESAEKAFSRVKICIRSNYSNPPAHGGLIVATILSDQNLKNTWLQELAMMRHRIGQMRNLFVHTLQKKGAKKDFSFISQQKGMFSFSGLNPAQIARLRNDFGIYAISSGRFNLAGITKSNVESLCTAILAVL